MNDAGKIAKEEWQAAILVLQKMYIDIAASYKRMSKVNDEYSWGLIQDSIDRNLQSAAEMRLKCLELRKRYFAEWEEAKKNISGDTNHGLGIGPGY